MSGATVQVIDMLKVKQMIKRHLHFLAPHRCPHRTFPSPLDLPHRHNLF